MKSASCRELAFTVLRHRESAGQFTEDLLTQEFSRTHLSSADRALAQELVYGTVRWEATLDWLIQRKTTPGRSQKSAVRLLLRLGLYQLFWLERIPDHAAVHQTVELAQQFGFGPQAGFINAVLRTYIREREATQRVLQELKNDQPALGHSHPDWLFERWEKRWGRPSAVALMQWNNSAPRTFARVNTLRTAPAALEQSWEAEQVDFEAASFPWTDEHLVYVLKSHPPLRELPSFQQGLFYVQDPSTLLAPELLGVEPGQAVLDLCAAPGGKATYLAQRMSNRGQIIAEDLADSRLKLLEENCARLGVTCVQARCTEAVTTGGAEQFDRVLLDAPCSNTGVLRRRVDLRWRIRAEELERLHKAQLQLLETAEPRLKPEGILVYSTCSLDLDENQLVTAEFLAMFPQFRLESERELLPFVDGVDGAYVARLRRT